MPHFTLLVILRHSSLKSYTYFAIGYSHMYPQPPCSCTHWVATLFWRSDDLKWSKRKWLLEGCMLGNITRDTEKLPRQKDSQLFGYISYNWSKALAIKILEIVRAIFFLRDEKRIHWIENHLRSVPLTEELSEKESVQDKQTCLPFSQAKRLLL